MTESAGQKESRWVTTVIMSTALQNHEISTILQRQQHRVRYSDSVEIGSVIFSLSGVAFILADTADLLRTGEEQVLDRIQKFINIHRNSFLVLSAALHGPEEWNIMFRIQRSLKTPMLRYVAAENIVKFCVLYFTPSQSHFLDLLLKLKHTVFFKYNPFARFLGSNLRIIPVHSNVETVKFMLTIAKITSKPCADDIRYKMAMAKVHIIEKSPVWKMLQQYQLHSS